MLQSNAQRFQDELLNFGNIVKQHEDNLTFFKAQVKQLHDSIVGLQVRLDKYHSSSTVETENDERSSAQIDKETIDQIMKHGNSAAGILCEMQVHKSLWSLSLSLIEDDMIGIVATLGRVDDDNLSRLLSEYLGLDTMLAIVCKTYDGVKSLEAYDKEGRVSKDSGIHFFGSNQGKVLQGRFQVICLEKLRPYSSSFVTDDPQKRLDMTKPTDRNGEIPAGFLGFAVNLIKVDIHHLYCLTSNGCGIRETLFYNLFSRLQVYRTRSDMLNALPCITDGAISLDGGMIRSNGVFSLGKREDVDVRFPKAKLDVPLEIFEIKKQIKQKEWEKERLKEDMQRAQSMLDQGKDNFQKKKQDLVNLLAERSRCMKQSINGGGAHPEETPLDVETCTALPDTEDGNSPSSNPVDYSSDFKTDEVWPDRESLLAWARGVASKKNMVLTIQKSWLSKGSQYGKVFLTCERYGNYRAAKNSEQSEEVELSRAKKSKKSGCTFALYGREFKGGSWRLEVECGFHNHELSPSLGHVFVGWLTEKEYSAVKKLSASGSKPTIKAAGGMKLGSPTDVTSRKQMYNARWRMKKEDLDGLDRGTRVLQDLGG